MPNPKKSFSTPEKVRKADPLLHYPSKPKLALAEGPGSLGMTANWPSTLS